MITWLIEESRPEQRTVENIATRILVVSFAAVQTTSNVSLVDSFFMHRLLMSPPDFHASLV